MASPARSGLLDATEPWTEQRYLALPPDRRRIELLDGGLLVSPSPGGPHQRLSSRLWYQLERARPDHLEALEAINVRVAPGKILIPDLAVVTTPGAGLTVWDAAQVALVVEIVGRGADATDRTVKKHLYAAAGIPAYLRIALTAGGPRAVGHRLAGGRYLEEVRAEPGTVLRLREPVALDVDVAALLAAPRLPG